MSGLRRSEPNDIAWITYGSERHLTQSENGLFVAFGGFDLFAIKALAGANRWETAQFRNNAGKLHRSAAEWAYAVI